VRFAMSGLPSYSGPTYMFFLYDLLAVTLGIVPVDFKDFFPPPKATNMRTASSRRADTSLRAVLQSIDQSINQSVSTIATLHAHIHFTPSS
jgi:hypothetical protein